MIRLIYSDCDAAIKMKQESQSNQPLEDQQCVTTPVESDTRAHRSENLNVSSSSAVEQPNCRQPSKQMNHNDWSILQQKVNVDSTMFQVMSIV
jgi:hypothetical protein